MEPFSPQEPVKLLPDGILDVDVRVPLVPLHDKPRHVPGLDHWWLQNVLVVQVEALHAMEKVHCFHLTLLIVQRFVVRVLGGPVL